MEILITQACEHVDTYILFIGAVTVHSLGESVEWRNAALKMPSYV